jgi:hypothetical protein
VHRDEQRLFQDLGATGAVPELRGDSIGVVHQNYAGNKIDWFLTRSLSYEVDWDPATGAVVGDLEVVLTNAAPAAGLPDSVIGFGGDEENNQTPTSPGENRMELSIYSAFPLESLTLDGAPLGAIHGREAGRHVYRTFVSLPAGTSRTVAARARGAIEPGAAYRLDPVWQPVVTPDGLDLRLQVPAGWHFEAIQGLEPTGRTAHVRWALDRDQSASAEAERAGNDLFRSVRGKR